MFWTDQSFDQGTHQLYTLPAAYRPSISVYPQSIYVPTAMLNTSKSSKDFLSINGSTGVVSLYSSATSNDWRYMHTMYFV
jgi:hypothetical protein